MTRKQRIQKEIVRLEEQAETARRLGDKDEIANLNIYIRELESQLNVDPTKEVPK